jgi:hypothetical protein
VDGALAVAVAYLPLVGLAGYFRAGTDRPAYSMYL